MVIEGTLNVNNKAEKSNGDSLVELGALAKRSPGTSASPVKSTSEELPRQFCGVVLIVFVQFLYIFAIGLAVPVLPTVFTNTPLAGGDEIKGGSLISLGAFINAAGELIIVSLLGILSDRHGRKPFLLLSCFGQVVDLGTAALVCAGPGSPAIIPQGHYWLFAARGIAGLCGNVFIFAKAYVGDVSETSRSARNFAALIAMVGIGIIVGLPVGAAMSQWSLRLPLLLATMLNVVAAAITAFCIREPRSRSQRKGLGPWRWREVNPFGALFFLLSDDFLKCFAVMSFMDSFTLTLLNTIFFQYTVVVYQVGRGTAASLLVVFGFGQAFVYVLVLRPLVKRWGEVPAVRVGYILSCVSFVLMAALSYQPERIWPLYLVMVCFSFGAISNPAEVAIASRFVGPCAQGRLQAANGVMDVVSKVAGSFLVFTVWEPSARAGQPGVVWWVAAFIMIPGVLLAFNIRRFLPLDFDKACARKDTPVQILDAKEESGQKTFCNAWSPEEINVDVSSEAPSKRSSQKETSCVSSADSKTEAREHPMPRMTIQSIQACPWTGRLHQCWWWPGFCTGEEGKAGSMDSKHVSSTTS